MDILIGTVVGAAIVLSVIGVLAYEADPPATYDYDVAWTTVTTDLPERTGSRVSNGAVDVPYEITGQNITRINWLLTVRGDSQARPQEVVISVQVQPPSGAFLNGRLTLPSGQGTSNDDTTVVAEIQPRPAVREVSARSVEEANATLSTQWTSANGTGAWTVRFNVQGATDERLPVGVEEFQFTVRAQLVSYAPRLTLRVPDISR